MLKEVERKKTKLRPLNNEASRLMFLLLVIVMFMAMATPLFAVENNKPIKLVLRYDDYRLCHPTNIDKQMIEIAMRHNLKMTIGVIPFLENAPLTEQHCDEMLVSGIAQGKLEIALHGFNHNNYQTTYYRQNSEFAGRSFSEQLSMIKAGRYAIEHALGIRVTSFIPPWNSYDAATIDSLQTMEFKVLSAHALGQGWSNNALKSVPVTFEMVNLRKAIEKARQTEKGDTYIIGLFHSFYFTGLDKIGEAHSMKSFEELVIWLRAQPDIETLTLSEAAQRNSNFSGENQKHVSRLFYLKSLMPHFLQKEQLTYPNTTTIRKQQLWVVAGISFFVLFILIVTAIFIWAILGVVSKRNQTLLKILTWFLLIFTFLLLFYSFKDSFFHIKRMIAVTVGTGIIAGLLARYTSKLKNR
jgi:hypothetical protein